MQTSKNANVKTANNSKIVNVNIDSITKRLSTITGVNVKTKDSIYNYPNDFSAIDISSKKGKSFRVKMRNNFEKIVNAYTMLQKQKELKTISAQNFTDSAKEILSVFTDFYKEYYRVNDFSFASVSQSNNEGKKEEILSFMNFAKGAQNIAPAKKSSSPAKKAEKTAPIVVPIANKE